MNHTKEVNINRNIDAREVTLIDEDGKRFGSINIKEALTIASNAGMDLVEVSSSNGVSVCKIMDYGKWRYERSKRDKKNKNQHQKQGIKEIQFHPNTSDNDLSYRAKRVDQFITNGHKVKLCVKFKGREVEHMYNTGMDLLERFLDLLSSKYKTDGVARVEGKTIILKVDPVNV